MNVAVQLSTASWCDGCGLRLHPARLGKVESIEYRMATRAPALPRYLHRVPPYRDRAGQFRPPACRHYPPIARQRVATNPLIFVKPIGDWVAGIRRNRRRERTGVDRGGLAPSLVTNADATIRRDLGTVVGGGLNRLCRFAFRLASSTQKWIPSSHDAATSKFW